MKRNLNFTRNRDEHGFSLIELLVVVAIMLVIAAIAIPAMLNSIRAGREAATASTLRTLNTAETGYYNSFGNQYAALVASLGGDPATCAAGTVSATAACEVDNTFVTATPMVKAGYTFTRTATPTTFVWVANPTGGILDGRRDFCVLQGGTIHATPLGTVGSITNAATCVAAPTL